MQQAIDGDKLLPASIAEGLKAAREQSFQDFDRGMPAGELVRNTSNLIDQVLEFCFIHFVGDRENSGCSLLAVGGYGRSELLPGSDIDLMILLQGKADKSLQEKISVFLTFCGTSALRSVKAFALSKIVYVRAKPM